LVFRFTKAMTKSQDLLAEREKTKPEGGKRGKKRVSSLPL